MIYLALALFAFDVGFLACEWIGWLHRPAQPLEVHAWEPGWHPKLIR